MEHSAQFSKEVNRAKRTFNVVSIALIKQLLILFKDSSMLKFIMEEIERFKDDPQNSHVPAVKFFGTMNLETKIAGRGENVVVGELVIRKDPILFTDAVGIHIPELDALGMNEKWPQLSPENQATIWDYLIRLAKMSAQVVIGMHTMKGQIESAIEELSKRKITAKPGMSKEEWIKYAEEVKRTLE